MSGAELVTRPPAAAAHGIEWVSVSAVNPPSRGDQWSQTVWMALSNGLVMYGQCLFAKDGSVHDWFIADHQIPDGLQVVAWMPFATPDHPSHALTTQSSAQSGDVLP